MYLKVQADSSSQFLSDIDRLLVKHFEGARGKAIERAQDDMAQLNIEKDHQASASNSSRYFRRHSAPESGESSRAADMLKKRDDCRPGCNCLCHIKREYKTPLLTRYVLGELSIHLRSQKSHFQCNCPAHAGLAVFYRFPRFILERYISLIMQTTYMDGPEFVLRVPRVLPWTHLLWRYAVCGDLMAIKRMYTNRQASHLDVDPAGRNALLYASKQDNVEIAHFFLNQGMDGDQPDNLGRAPSDSLLRKAFGGVYGEPGKDLTRRLLNGDDSKNEFGFKQLHQIVLGFLRQDMKALLNQTTEIIESTDALGRTPLFWAVICDSEPYTNLLLSHGAKVNARDLQGYTPLDFVRGAVVCRLLLKAGATMNVNPQNWDHSSLHEHVIENGCADVISVFHEWKFDIDVKDHDGETPLLNSIYAGDTSVVERLIELGADVNKANDSSKDSALHFAAHFDRSEILRMLLDKEADYTALECNGRNLAHCAAMKGSTAFVEVMKASRLDRLDLSLKDAHGKTAGDYMQAREVLSDGEVGVHEAWEDFVASLPALPAYADVVDAQRPADLLTNTIKAVDDFKVPGAFPVVTVQEFGAAVAVA